MLVDIIDKRVLQQVSNALTALQSSSNSRRTNFVRDPFGHNANVVLKNKKEKPNFAANFNFKLLLKIGNTGKQLIFLINSKITDCLVIIKKLINK